VTPDVRGKICKCNTKKIDHAVLVIILSISEQLQTKRQLVSTAVPLFFRIALAILFTALLFVEGKDTDIFPNYQILFSKNDQ